MLRTQAVGMRPCRPRSGLLTWHPSASTADSLLRLRYTFYFVQSAFVQLFTVQLLDFSVLFSDLILELYSRYFNPIKNNSPASQ
jgi:hypothetical protein